MKTILAVVLSLILPAGSAFGAKNGVELRCGSPRNKSFPYTLEVRKSRWNKRKRVMTLVRGRKVVLRTPVKKVRKRGQHYAVQYHYGKNFNISVPQGRRTTGYLRAKYRSKFGKQLVAGTMACKKI